MAPGKIPILLTYHRAKHCNSFDDVVRTSSSLAVTREYGRYIRSFAFLDDDLFENSMVPAGQPGGYRGCVGPGYN